VNVTSNNPFKLPGGPSAKARRLGYALIWVPTLVLLFYVLPQFTPIFDKFEKTGDLPKLTAWLMAVVRMNDSAFYVPVLAFVLGLLILDAQVVAWLRKRQKAEALVWSWFVVVCSLSIGAFFLVGYSMISPVFKMSGAVA
jgi:hypothetical protein